MTLERVLRIVTDQRSETYRWFPYTIKYKYRQRAVDSVLKSLSVVY